MILKLLSILQTTRASTRVESSPRVARGRGKPAMPVEDLPDDVPEVSPTPPKKKISRSQAEYNQLLHESPPAKHQAKKRKAAPVEEEDDQEEAGFFSDLDDFLNPGPKLAPTLAGEEERFMKVERERLLASGVSLYDPYSPHNKKTQKKTPKKTPKETSTPKATPQSKKKLTPPAKKPSKTSTPASKKTPKGKSAAAAVQAIESESESDVSISQVPKDDFPEKKVDDYFTSGGEKEFAMCELWEKYPILYNTEAPGYEKKDMRLAALRKMAYKLEIPSE